MIKSLIPKEYVLESPRNYDIVRTESLVKACMLVAGEHGLIDTKYITGITFNTEEDRRIAGDIFRYIYDTHVRLNIDEFVRIYIRSLSESGFFG